jgi:secreted PhoX family phosphatase
MAAFPERGGGYVLVSNAETLDGGASALRFGADGSVRDAYRILSGTTQNCSGGGTPWGTWLSCEEVEDGRVWECDPAGREDPVAHPAMGIFKHEAAAVDPRARCVYLSEDLIDGGLYRFAPERWPRLSEGLLEIARVGKDGAVEWIEVPDPSAARERTRRQVDGSSEFARGEGLWLDGHTLYLATTADHRVHAYDTRGGRIRVIYDGLASAEAPLLRVDQLTGTRAGEVFVCEDIATEEIDIGLIAPDRSVSKFLSVTGPQHRGSELTGVTFDPSGTRMYFSSQRAFPESDSLPGPGAIYEVSGPFRGAAQLSTK